MARIASIHGMINDFITQQASQAPHD